MFLDKTGPGLAFRSLLLTAAVTCLPQIAVAETVVPPSVAALLPASLKLDTQSFDVLEHEFGKVINGQIRAGFPDAVTCDFTVGPYFELKLEGDNAWEASPEQLAMWEQMTAPDFEAMRNGLVDDVNLYAKGSTFAEPKNEQLPNGHISYLDFTWKCDKSPEGKNVRLDGYARRGTTVLNFYFWANGTSEKAIAIAKEIFTQFETMNLAELYALPPTR